MLKGFRVFDNPDVLALACNTTATTISYTGILSGWGPTTLAEIDNELMLVVEVDTDNKIATVVRGWLGTTPASHALNQPIYLNPRMLRSDVLHLFNDCLEGLYGQDLYAVDTFETTYNAAKIGYDLESAVTNVLRVDAQTDGQASLWEQVFDWQFIDNAPSEFASGKALMLRSSLPFGATIRVVYAKPFTPLNAETEDLISDVGLRPYMTDCLFYYAMNRLMVDSERHRSQGKTAQNHQRAQDSPPFLALRTGEWYQARYNDRVRLAQTHLKRETKSRQGTGYGS